MKGPTMRKSVKALVDVLNANPQGCNQYGCKGGGGAAPKATGSVVPSDYTRPKFVFEVRKDLEGFLGKAGVGKARVEYTAGMGALDVFLPSGYSDSTAKKVWSVAKAMKVKVLVSADPRMTSSSQDAEYAQFERENRAAIRKRMGR